MLEKPNLPDSQLIAGLRAGYGLAVTTLEFLPIGYDASAWLYRVNADQPYFLKLKRGPFYLPSVTVPHYLKTSGIEPVVAPLPTTSGDLWHALNADYSLILFPYIEAENGMDVGLTDAQWQALGSALKQIHAQTPGLDGIRVETFTLKPQWLDGINIAQKRINAGDLKTSYEWDFAAFWQSRQPEITRIVSRAVQLGRELQAAPPEFVLCHTDIHTANVLVAGTATIHIVDWDMPLYAPRERDLMFMVERGAAEARQFFTGYGHTAIHSLALAYYRYEWVVQEFGDYAARLFLMDNMGEETHAAAVDSFKELFNPGDVVEEAYKIDNLDE